MNQDIFHGHTSVFIERTNNTDKVTVIFLRGTYQDTGNRIKDPTLKCGVRTMIGMGRKIISSTDFNIILSCLQYALAYF